MITIKTTGHTKQECAAIWYRFSVNCCFFQVSYRDVRVEPKRLSAEELMFLNCGAGEDAWESLGLQGDQTNES